MHLTVSTTLDAESIEHLVTLYRRSFAHLDARAPHRQRIEDDELRHDLADPGLLKFVGWNDAGRPVALALVTTDLEKAPFISPGYFAHRWPDESARKAVYYVISIVVRPGSRHKPWLHALVEAMFIVVRRNDGVVATDYCGFNDDVLEVPRMIDEVTSRFARAERELLDTQRYYAYTGLELDQPELADQRFVDLAGIRLDLAIRDEAPAPLVDLTEQSVIDLEAQPIEG